MKKILILSIFSLLLGSCFSSETNPSAIWDIELSIFKNNLTEKRYDFLQNIDFEKMVQKNRHREIFRYHPGGAYYLSFIFEELNQQENQLLFLKLEMLEGIWKKRAAEELRSVLSRQNNWSTLIEYLEIYIEKNPDDFDILSILIEALYKNGQFERAVSYEKPDFSSIYLVLSQISIEGFQWRESLRDYLYNGSSPEDIEVIYKTLLEKNQFYSVGNTERLFMLSMTSYNQGRYAESGEYLEELEISDDLFSRYPSLYYTLRLPIQKSGLAGLWSDKFLKRISFNSSFNAARLNIWERDYAAADTLLRSSYNLAGSDFEQDRASWYLMDLYINNASRLTSLIEEFAPLWHDPFYFSDIFEDFLNLVVSRREWTLFNRIYPLVISYGDDKSIAAFSWVKYINSINEGISPEESDLLLNRMENSEHMGFYNLMGTLLSGNTLEFDDFVSQSSAYSGSDNFIDGFLDFSLDVHAIKYSSGLEKQLSNDILRNLSILALKNGNELRSIQLISHLSIDAGQKHSLHDIKLLYPRKYEDMIDLYSDQYGFSGEILSGIIRTESAFTHDIISYAGAVGLSQLMPDTAAEQARKLKIMNPDLTDPETNIHIGSAYVRWILDRDWSENLSQMLIAYNAGGGNLRKWKRMFPHYRDELFVEALPYKETRNYVKKVLTSSIVYGAVYQGQNPEDIVHKIYPDFSTLKSTQN